VAVVKDWGEVIVATNVLLEPLLQPVLFRMLADLGNAHRDSVLPHFAFSIYRDEERHWDWARALTEMLHEHDPTNAEVTAEWVDTWLSRAERAVEPLGQVFALAGSGEIFDDAYSAARSDVRSTVNLAPEAHQPDIVNATVDSSEGSL
jgi:hypothetical protein